MPSLDVERVSRPRGDRVRSRMGQMSCGIPPPRSRRTVPSSRQRHRSHRHVASPLTLSTRRRPTHTRTREAARIAPEATAHVECEGDAHRGTVHIDERVLKERAYVMSHDHSPR
jgi:hypothetical protein